MSIDEKDRIIATQQETIRKLENKIASKISYIKWLHTEYEKEHNTLKSILNQNL